MYVIHGDTHDNIIIILVKCYLRLGCFRRGSVSGYRFFSVVIELTIVIVSVL